MSTWLSTVAVGLALSVSCSTPAFLGFGTGNANENRNDSLSVEIIDELKSLGVKMDLMTQAMNRLIATQAGEKNVEFLPADTASAIPGIVPVIDSSGNRN